PIFCAKAISFMTAASKKSLWTEFPSTKSARMPSASRSSAKLTRDFIQVPSWVTRNEIGFFHGALCEPGSPNARRQNEFTRVQENSNEDELASLALRLPHVIERS